MDRGGDGIGIGGVEGNGAGNGAGNGGGWIRGRAMQGLFK